MNSLHPVSYQSHAPTPPWWQTPPLAYPCCTSPQWGPAHFNARCPSVTNLLCDPIISPDPIAVMVARFGDGTSYFYQVIPILRIFPFLWVIPQGLNKCLTYLYFCIGIFLMHSIDAHGIKVYKYEKKFDYLSFLKIRWREICVKNCAFSSFYGTTNMNVKCTINDLWNVPLRYFVSHFMTNFCCEKLGHEHLG